MQALSPMRPCARLPPDMAYTCPSIYSCLMSWLVRSNSRHSSTVIRLGSLWATIIKPPENGLCILPLHSIPPHKLYCKNCHDLRLHPERMHHPDRPSATGTLVVGVTTQTFLNPSDFSQCPGQTILSGIGGELAQDQ